MIRNTAKRKRRTVLISLILILLILTGVYFVLTAGPKEKEEPIIASRLDVDSITEIAYSFNNKKIELIKKGDLWILGSDENCPLNQEQIKSMVYSAAAVNAERVVDDSADDFKRFGLDHPDITIWITGGNGDTVTYYLKSYREDSSGYYFTVSGADKIYFVKASLFSWFSVDVSELIVMDQFPRTDEKKVTGFSITSADSAIEAVYIKDPSEITYLKDSHWFLKNGGGLLAADTDKTKRLVNNILTLSPDSCAYYDATKEELASCGLNEPKAAVRIHSDQPYSINIGSKDESENYYYIMQSQSPMVYLVKSEAVDEILRSASADLLPAQICGVDLKKFDSLKIGFNGNTYDVIISRNNNEASCTVNGEKADQDSFLAFCESIKNLGSDGLAEGQSYAGDMKPYVSIILKSGSFSDLTLNIYPYDINFYRVEFDGNDNLLAGEKSVGDIAEKLTNLIM